MSTEDSEKPKEPFSIENKCGASKISSDRSRNQRASVLLCSSCLLDLHLPFTKTITLKRK
jgi:hypothetical protein